MGVEARVPAGVGSRRGLWSIDRLRKLGRYRLPSSAARLIVYVILVDIAFVFLFPMIYMITTAIKDIRDSLDPTVIWIPTRVSWDSLRQALAALDYWTTVQNSTIVALSTAILQVISCSLAGYGFARLRFPGRELLFALVLFTFIVPPQTIIVSLFLFYKNLGWLDSFKPFIVPAIFAQGLKGPLFVIIFRQFFRGLAWELEDAARIDGASAFGVYWRIMLPLAKPAILVVFLFSIVWHWNDFFEPMMYIMASARYTVPLRLALFWFMREFVSTPNIQQLNEPLRMAGAVLVILPPLVLYAFTQRHFVESIERTGLVE